MISTDYASAIGRILPGTFAPDIGASAVRTEPIPSGSSDALTRASGVGGIGAAGTADVSGAAGAAGVTGSAPVSFRDTLKNYLEGVNDKMVSANQATQDLATGKTNDINKVVTSVEEANLTMDFTVAMQSKLLAAYQQISEMQM